MLRSLFCFIIVYPICLSCQPILLYKLLLYRHITGDTNLLFLIAHLSISLLSRCGIHLRLLVLFKLIESLLDIVSGIDDMLNRT